MDLQNEDLRRAIKRALAKSRKDRGSAARHLADMVKSSKKLLNLLDYLILKACERIITEHEIERRPFNTGYKPPLEKGQSGETLERGNRARVIADDGWMNASLPIKGYPKIKDATIEQLRQAAAVYTGWETAYGNRKELLTILADKKERGVKITERLCTKIWEEITDGYDGIAEAAE